MELRKPKPDHEPEPLWKGPVHFVLRSAEASMPGRDEKPEEIEDLLLRQQATDLSVVPESEEHIDRGYN